LVNDEKVCNYNQKHEKKTSHYQNQKNDIVIMMQFHRDTRQTRFTSPHMSVVCVLACNLIVALVDFKIPIGRGMGGGGGAAGYINAQSLVVPNVLPCQNQQLIYKFVYIKQVYVQCKHDAAVYFYEQ
jgi:hypothetical protein